MALSTLINRPATILRRTYDEGVTDDYGNAIGTDEAIETVCEIQQRARTEPAGAGELSVTEWLAIFPAGVDLRTGDAVVVDGAVYELIGDPWAARNPRTQAESHIEATLRRTAGDEDVGS